MIQQRVRSSIENWMDQYGSHVYAAAWLYTGSLAAAEFVYERTFTNLFHKERMFQRFPTPLTAAIEEAIRLCSEWHPPQASFDTDGLNHEQSFPPNQPLCEKEEAGSCTTLGKEDFDVWLSRIQSLDSDHRRLFILYVLGDCNPERLTRAVLLPRRMLLRQLRDAVMMVAGDGSASTDSWVDVRTRVQSILSQVCIPEAVRVRGSKVLRAHMAMSLAQKHHRGPRLWQWASLGVFVFSGAAIGVGVAYSADSTVNAAVQPPEPAKTADGLPAPLSHLPTSVVAQFRLSGNDDSVFQHMVLTTDAVYLPQLQTATDDWPKISVQRLRDVDTGTTLDAGMQSVGTIEMVPPMSTTSSIGSSAADAWTIHTWNLSVTGSWVVATVRWESGKPNTLPVYQLYGLNMESGKSGLMGSFAPHDGQEVHTITVGDGKVVVQWALQASGRSGSAASGPVGLPIDVYSLQGDEPLHALSSPRQLPGSFGLMENPAIVGDILVFQGVSASTDTRPPGFGWYTVSWTGQMTKYNGAPNDGQPHWAVRGTSGKLWWCETTPDSKDPHKLQVLMGPLSDPSGQSDQEPAMTLDGSVRFFTASDQDVAWVQTSSTGESQLVIESVQ